MYVGGIPYYSTEDDIRSYLDSCGTITEVDCMTFPESGKFRGIAIIGFKVGMQLDWFFCMFHVLPYFVEAILLHYLYFELGCWVVLISFLVILANKQTCRNDSRQGCF